MRMPHAVVIFLLFAPAAAAQTASSLQGRVVKWGTADPISKATVELRRVEAGTPAPYIATTAADGTFVFAAVPAGQYRIVSTRPGYVNAEYGQRWPNGAGTPLTVLRGRSVSNLPIPMLATAAVSGRVRDRLDQPIGNVEVQALRVAYQDGRRVLNKIESAVTDDRGEYRLFWLPPGRYYLSARHPDLGNGLMRFAGVAFSGGAGIGPSGTFQFQEFRNSGDNAGATTPPIEALRERFAERERYLPVYFPGATDEQAATAVELLPGGEQIGIDFTLEPVPLQHVRGRVLYESNSEPAMSARVQSVSSSGSTSMSVPDNLLIGPVGRDAPHAVQCCDGTFDFALPPGSYTIVAAVNNLNARAGVQVGYGDVDGLLLSLGQSFNLTGRVTFEGRAPTPAELNALHVSLAMNPPVAGLEPNSYSVVLPTGELTVAAGRGDFRLSISPLLMVRGGNAPPPRPGLFPASDLYVKSIRLGEADVLNGGLHLDGRPDAPLEIVIGTTPGSVEGVVVNQNRDPVPNITVSLLPDPGRRARIDLYKTVSTDANGRFRIERVPPGDYVAFAWDGIESGDWQNPEFVAPYEPRGTPVRVRDSAPANVELTTLTPSP